MFSPLNFGLYGQPVATGNVPVSWTPNYQFQDNGDGSVTSLEPSTSSWRANGRSSLVLPSGADGGVTFTYPGTTPLMAIGFIDAADTPHATGSYTPNDCIAMTWAALQMKVFENTLDRGIKTIAGSDVTVRIENGVYELVANGVVAYTSALTPPASSRILLSIYGGGYPSSPKVTPPFFYTGNSWVAP